MKIGIVEDEEVWRDKIRASVEKYCRDKNISARIMAYESGGDFMENADADLLFLDIELAEGEDGLRIAEELRDSGSQCRINLRDLLLVETNGRKLRYLMLDSSEHICEGRISETAQSLSSFGFSYVQRSYIVNLKYIESASSREIMLCNGLKIAIGRAHNREFKKEFFKWRMLFDD